MAAVANQAGAGDFSSSSSTFRPTLSADSINGHAALEFTTVDAFGRSIQASLGLGAAATLCLVTEAPGPARYLYDGTVTADTRCLLYSASQLRLYAGTYGPSIAVPTPGDWIVSVGVFNGASSRQTINGGVANTAGNVGGGAPVGVLLGARMGTAAGNSLQGKIARALIYDGALSDTDRVDVETYLMGWAGLP